MLPRVLWPLALLCCAGLLPTQAATRTWTGAAADFRWATPGNWAGNIAPTTDDDVEVPATPESLILDSNLRISSLTVASGGQLHIRAATLEVARSWVAPDCRIRVSEAGVFQATATPRLEAVDFVLESGAQLLLPALTDAGNSTFEVSGGARFAAPPTLLGIDFRRPAYGSGNPDAAPPLFRVRGPGSTLDLRSVRSLRLSASAYVDIEASDGAELNLASCETLNGSPFVLSARSGGRLLLDRLTLLEAPATGTRGRVEIALARQALPALEVLRNVRVALHPEGLAEGATLALPKAVEILDTTLHLPDRTALETPVLRRLLHSDVVLLGTGTLGMEALTEVDDSTFDLDRGARLTLPAAIEAFSFRRGNYGGGNPDAAPPLFRARGQGTRLDLGSVRSLVIASASFVGIEAAEGAELNLGRCESLSGWYAAISARALGTLRLDHLTILDGGNPESVSKSRLDLSVAAQALPALRTLRNYRVALHPEGLPTGANLTLPETIEITGATLELPDGAALQTPRLERLLGSDVRLSGSGRFDLLALRSVADSTFDLADAARLTLPPGLKRIEYHRPTGSGNPAAAPPLFSAQGAGTKLDLGSVEAIVIGSSSYMGIAASDGGEIDLSRCQAIAGGYLSLLQKSRGILRLDGLIDFQGLDAGVAPNWLEFDAPEFTLPSLQFVRRLRCDVRTGRRLQLGTGDVEVSFSDIRLEPFAELAAFRIRLLRSLLAGTGTIIAQLANGGILDPGNVRNADTGTLTLRGDLEAVPGTPGLIHLDLSGRSAPFHDLLIVEGNADLTHQLEVTSHNGYAPGFADIVIPVEWQGFPGGQVAEVLGARTSTGLEWTPEILSGFLRLSATAGRGPVVVATSPDRVTPTPFERWQVVFNEPIDAASLPTSRFQLTSPTGTPVGPVSVLRRNARTFDITWPPQSNPGRYLLALEPGATDTAGFPMTTPFHAEIDVRPPADPTGGLSIIQHPESQRTGEGGTVAFTVAAAGPTPLTFQWYRNGNRIVGATQPTLLLPGIRIADAGAYSVVVSSSDQHLESVPAILEVVLPAVEMADRFADRPTHTASRFAGTTSNRGTGAEPGEPRHAGRAGGRSLWLSWKAPASGVATFSTEGSTFDTLLAVYAGSRLQDLVAGEIASDDDSGETLTSTLRFNAVAGTDYQVAVDGYAGDSGNIVLSWNLTAGATPLPRLTEQPAGLLDRPGRPGELRVAAVGTDLEFQWFKDGQILPGATQPVLRFAELLNNDAGTYHATVRSAGGPAITTDKVQIQLVQRGNAATGLGDKPEDTFQEVFSGGSAAQPAAPPAPGFTAVAFGIPGGLAANNSQATRQAGESLPCSVAPDGNTLWWRFRASRSGPITLDTFGSRVDTVVTLLRGLRNRQPVACNDDARPPDGASQLTAEVVAGEDYLVQVDSINGSGLILLNWVLGENALPDPVVLQTTLSPDGIQLRFQSNPGPYRIETSPDLVHWTRLREGTSQGAETVLLEPRSFESGATFFRVRLP